MRTAVNTARQGSPRISGARGRLSGPVTPRGRETEGWPGPGSAAVAVLKGQSRERRGRTAEAARPAGGQRDQVAGWRGASGEGKREASLHPQG